MAKDMACPDCDLLVALPALAHGERATCPRCGAFLTRYCENAHARAISYATTALILLVLANSYSFLAFSSSGLESDMTLWQTPGALWNYGMVAVALIVGAFILVIPALVLALLLILCIPLALNRHYPWLVPAARAVFLTRNWAMVEVFIIGVIVALVKIASMATVTLGISFWAYAAFAVCFILAESALDRVQCWTSIEALEAT